MRPTEIDINDYDYDLPEARIALRPAAERDRSRLLLYRQGELADDAFFRLPDHLPPGALLLFNDTRVIEARLPFRRASGARIELFCLEPLQPAEHQQNLGSAGPVVWSCLVGNNRRWKEEWLTRSLELDGRSVELRARRLGRREGAFRIELAWDAPDLTFAEILHRAGHTPLPPYIKRPDEPADQRRYQTVYAERDGSVAAPTAGLHFSQAVLDALDRKGIERRAVTLHVGAGTFLPVKTDRLGEHAMHREKIWVPGHILRALRDALAAGRPIIPVGTTSMRTLESLYWHALAVLANDAPPHQLDVRQWDPYELDPGTPPLQALHALLGRLDEQGADEVSGQTQLLIAPGYRFALSRGLITNFHQPRSTLLLLVAALIGEDWRRVYRYALQHEFRFLSYGDSSLLLP